METTDNVRYERMKSVLDHRQPDIHVYMENVQDQHNFSAIIRTCDAMGVMHMYREYNNGLKHEKQLNVGVSLGTDKRVRLNQITDQSDFFTTKKQDWYQIITTHLATDTVDFREIDYTKPTVLVIGNERDGTSKSIINHADHTIKIPMVGMAQSLNVSVATGIVMAEIQRQRKAAGMYETPQLSWQEYEHILHQRQERERLRKKVDR